MAKKEDIFSKLNIKDYNNQLEKILENKSFSEDAKNILLTILYKIETSYEDYSKVKVYVDLKSELLLEDLHDKMEKILVNQRKILKYIEEDKN